jgi:hypothetical protein
MQSEPASEGVINRQPSGNKGFGLRLIALPGPDRGKWRILTGIGVEWLGAAPIGGL